MLPKNALMREIGSFYSPPRALATLTLPTCKTNKSLSAYSLSLTPGGIQPLTANGRNGRPNGDSVQRMGLDRGRRGGYFLASERGDSFPSYRKATNLCFLRSEARWILGTRADTHADFQSFKTGRKMAIVKWANRGAPSSSWSQRTKQCSLRYLATRASGMPR